MKNAITLMLGALYSLNIFASSSAGEVSSLTVNNQNQILVSAGPMSNMEPCATLLKYVADLNTEHGKAMYSMLLSAQSQAKIVTIYGTGSCDIRVNAESIRNVNIED